MADFVEDGGAPAVGEVQGGEAPAPQAPAAPGPAPWQKDLDGLELGDFTPKVDQYLREQWQPRVTKLEQDYAKYNDLFGGEFDNAEAASAMFGAFREDPEQAFMMLANAMGYKLDGEQEGPQEPQAPEAPQPQDSFSDEDRQWIAQQRQIQEQQQQEQILRDYLGEVAKDYGDNWDEQTYLTLFVGTNGDEAATKQMYDQFIQGRQPAAPAQTAPPVLSDNTGTAAAQAAEPPSSIDEAMAQYRAEEQMRRAKR